MPMPNLTPRRFPELTRCDAISKGAMDSHVRLYEGYVGKYNQLSEKLKGLQARGPMNGGVGPDSESVKCDLTFALAAIKNHELFFENLSPPVAEEPSGPLADALVKSFHSIPQYLVDLKQSCQTARGWAWTAYDMDHDFIFNYGGGSQDSLPVWNSVPILAVDLYGHAYFYDYGNNKIAYVESIMKSIRWEKVAQRLHAAHAIRARAMS
jgi:Fe-Mn family superoxide dismutase